MDAENFALVVDDRPLVARGIAQYLESHCGFSKADTVPTDLQCLQWIERHGCPALVVIDYGLPGGATLGLVEQLSSQFPNARVLVMSGDAQLGMQESVRRAGAHGFLSKSATPEVFLRAVTTLRSGHLHFLDADATPDDSALTARQSEVLAMVLRGLPNKRIAQELALSEATIKEHVSSIFEKLGARSRVEVIARFQSRK